jgi:hypothetical protein
MIGKTLQHFYQPLVERFVEELKDVNKTGLPEPFIPVCGEQYNTAEVKIAFIGWETRGENELLDFCNSVTEKDPGSLERSRYKLTDISETGAYYFTTYGNSGGTAFWDFNMKFLGSFHNMKWKVFKNGHVSTFSDMQKRVLESFVWGNIEAIERFEVTAKGSGGSMYEWQKVKEASRILDDASLLVKVFRPDLIIVEKCNKDKSWLTKNCRFTHEKLNGAIDYFYLMDTGTHVYWTYHPLGMLRQGMVQDEIIETILLSYCEKEQKKLIPFRSRISDLNVMNAHLAKTASAMGLEFFPMKPGVAFAGFYFRKPSWSNYRIGFEFEDEWGQDFFKGIWRDKKKQVTSNESIKEKFCMKETPTEQYPYWDWWGDDCRNWNNDFYKNIHDRIFEFETDLRQMLSKMEDLENQGVKL